MQISGSWVIHRNYLAGTWVGCDDRFITIESSAYFGGSVARPIWEAFFKKVYADKTLGIDKDARFAKPAEMENEFNSADLDELIDNTEPGAEAMTRVLAIRTGL